MSHWKHSVLVAVVVMVVAGMSLPAMAQQARGGGRKPKNGNTGNTNNNPNGGTAAPTAAPGNTSGASGDVPVNAAIAGEQIKAQAAELKDARISLQQAQADMDALVAARSAEFDKTPEIQKLIQQVADDTKALNDLTAVIRDKITEKHPEYPSLVTQREAAKVKLTQVTAAKAEKDEVVFRTYQFNELDEKVKEIDNNYFAKDGSFSAAVKKLKEDNDKLAAARDGINAVLASDGDYKAMALTLAGAKVRLAALEAKSDASGMAP